MSPFWRCVVVSEGGKKDGGRAGGREDGRRGKEQLRTWSRWLVASHLWQVNCRVLPSLAYEERVPQ